MYTCTDTEMPLLRGEKKSGIERCTIWNPCVTSLIYKIIWKTKKLPKYDASVGLL